MFHPELLSFFALLKRSPDVLGPAPDMRSGWKAYSDTTSQLVFTNDTKFPGLFEIDKKHKIVRATAEGEVLVKWMNYVPPKGPVDAPK